MTTYSTVVPPRSVRIEEDGMSQTVAGPRCLMWIDGVGGYLVCFGDQIRIGQAAAVAHLEVSVQGDLSRHHATLTRAGGAYVLEPIAKVWVNSQPVVGPRSLRDGDTIRLGDSFVMRFRQPHPLSATSRLEFLSAHRTQPAADGVLLMAASCILGPGANSHVVCRHWPTEVVLVRQGQSLACHTSGSMEVDGKTFERRAPVSLDSHISGEEFSLTLERFS